MYANNSDLQEKCKYKVKKNVTVDMMALRYHVRILMSWRSQEGTVTFFAEVPPHTFPYPQLTLLEFTLYVHKLNENIYSRLSQDGQGVLSTIPCHFPKIGDSAKYHLPATGLITVGHATPAMSNS